MNQLRIRTTTRNPVLRLLFVAVALLLRNLWAWLHWCALAKRRRGGRRPSLERLRLRVMANWLLHWPNGGSAGPTTPTPITLPANHS